MAHDFVTSLAARMGRWQVKSGDSSQAGLVTLLLELVTAPANDNFDGRTVLNGTSMTIVGNTHLATHERDEPITFTDTAKSVWYEWTPPGGAAGLLSLSTTGSSFNLMIGVFADRNGTIEGLTSLGAFTDCWYRTSCASLFVVPNQRVAIAVDGRYGSSGDVVLQLKFVAQPVNDNFADRTILPYKLVTVAVGTTTGATHEAGEPCIAPSASSSLWCVFRDQYFTVCVHVFGRGARHWQRKARGFACKLSSQIVYWRNRYAWTPPVDGKLFFSLQWSSYQAVAAVWIDTNGNFDGLQQASASCVEYAGRRQIGCVYSESVIVVKAGMRYAIQVDAPPSLPQYPSSYDDDSDGNANLFGATGPDTPASLPVGSPSGSPPTPILNACSAGASDSSSSSSSESEATRGGTNSTHTASANVNAAAGTPAANVPYRIGGVYMTLLMQPKPGNE